MMKLVPKNWSTFQHYKDRSPPWIKLHKALLDDRKYQRLPLASKALAPMLWLIASESKDGSFDGSIEELAFRLRAEGRDIEAGLQPLIEAGFFEVAEAQGKQPASAVPTAREQDASNTEAARLQVAVPETETEGETELEAYASVGKADAVPACPFDELIDAYEQTLPMLPQVRRSLFRAGRSATAMRQRWRWVLTSNHERGERAGTRIAETQEQGVEWFRKFFRHVERSDFLTGRDAKWASCDLAWLMTASKFEAVLNGRYHVAEGT